MKFFGKYEVWLIKMKPKLSWYSPSKPVYKSVFYKRIRLPCFTWNTLGSDQYSCTNGKISSVKLVINTWHGSCANVDNRISIALASSSAVISSSSTTGVARALLWSFGKITLLLSFSIAWVEVFSLSNNGNCDKRRAVINSFLAARENVSSLFFYSR